MTALAGVDSPRLCCHRAGMTVPPIRAIAESLQGQTVEEARAAELAAEVSRLNEAVRRAAVARLTLADEPAGFAALLMR